MRATLLVICFGNFYINLQTFLYVDQQISTQKWSESTRDCYSSYATWHTFI